MRYRLLLLIATLCVTAQSRAALPPDPPASQRAQYRAAAAALARGDDAPFRRYREALRDYPLTPYLELAELRRRLTRANTAEVDAFLARYPGQLPAQRLRNSWLSTLESQRRWPDYVRYYVPDPANLERRCHFARALQLGGRDAEAEPEILALWRQPASLPGNCDSVLQAWFARGKPGNDLAWERFHLAMGAGQSGLANYLLRFMSGNHAADARLYLEVQARPARVREPGRFAADNPRHAQIAGHGVGRLAATDARAARETFEALQRAGVLDDEAMRAAAPRIASALAAAAPATALQWIIGLPASARPDTLAEDAVRYALRDGDWNAIAAALDSLPASLAAEQRWQYWAARSAESRSGATPGSQRESFGKVRGTRSWYGFLAADRMGSSYEMQHLPLAIDDARLAAIAAHPGLRRAREFERMGEVLESRREWTWAVTHMNNEERQGAAKLAARWGWHQLAISALAAAQEWNDLDLRFPVLYPEQFASAARSQRVDPAWLYAIARQESAFNAGARSPAGALGLMQVMPTTAQQTARKAGIRYTSSADLLNPGTNVVIGSRYVRLMLDDFQQNRILAAAAYNVGPGRVRQWLRRLPANVEHDTFVETIPFRETRQYVQNVLSFAVIYAYLQGREVPLVQPPERLIRNPYVVQTNRGG